MAIARAFCSRDDVFALRVEPLKKYRVVEINDMILVDPKSSINSPYLQTIRVQISDTPKEVSIRTTC